MKKTLFLLAVAVLFLQVSVFSQKTRVGVTAGITTSNMYGEVGGKDLRDDSKPVSLPVFWWKPRLAKAASVFSPASTTCKKAALLKSQRK